MVIRGKEFEDIYDLVGIRILVESLRDTYGALGAVHALWTRSRDGSRTTSRCPSRTCTSRWHTTVVGPGGKPLEIQIRHARHAPHRQYGIAAHWRYKEGGGQAERKRPQDLAWLGQMMDWLKDMADPREFMEGLRIDLSGGRVFVFTPKGDVTNLPAGATPVDFAYTVHTESGTARSVRR